MSVARVSGQLVELQLAFLCGLHGGAIGNANKDRWCPGMVFLWGACGCNKCPVAPVSVTPIAMVDCGNRWLNTELTSWVIVNLWLSTAPTIYLSGLLQVLPPMVLVRVAVSLWPCSLPPQVSLDWPTRTL